MVMNIKNSDAVRALEYYVAISIGLYHYAQMNIIVSG